MNVQRTKQFDPSSLYTIDPFLFASHVHFTNVHVPCWDLEEETEQTFTRKQRKEYRKAVLKVQRKKSER